jgi:anionic cell wall polymer biosynthesis LytR-Cps2A-Psr (LCP) family protein
MKNRAKLLKRTCLLLVLVLTVGLFPLPGLTESESGEQKNGDWVNFLLMCNEGMNNSGGNAGNTMMIVAMDPVRGHIRLMMLTWDTFVHYQGYDVLQRMDMPYRKGGPEETLKVFKDNFHIDVDLFMSLTYLNLATMIDRFGGIKLDITRAERNALNGMVASKKENIQTQADLGLLSQLVMELLADVEPGVGGEIQLTDALDAALTRLLGIICKCAGAHCAGIDRQDDVIFG